MNATSTARVTSSRGTRQRGSPGFSHKPSTHRCPSRVQPTKAVESPDAEPSNARTTRSRGCTTPFARRQLSTFPTAATPRAGHPLAQPQLTEHRFANVLRAASKPPRPGTVSHASAGLAFATPPVGGVAPLRGGELPEVERGIITSTAMLHQPPHDAIRRLRRSTDRQRQDSGRLPDTDVTASHVASVTTCSSSTISSDGSCPCSAPGSAGSGSSSCRCAGPRSGRRDLRPARPAPGFNSTTAAASAT